MKKRTMLLAAWLVLGANAPAPAALRVVASTTDLGSIAAAIGGQRVEIQVIARPTADVHRVEVLPSYMVRVAKAQLYLKVGLGLDAWADGIIDGSRNGRLKVLDCSHGIEVREKPTSKVSAAQGDVHPEGNPHYWLDPRNGAIIGRAIARELGTLDPAHASDFMRRAEDFVASAQAAYQRGQEAVAAMPVREIVTYHASWVYFAHAFGLTIPATIEPVPGIPPTGRHLQELVDVIRGHRIPVVLQEPYFGDDAAEFLGRETGVRVVKTAPSCDSVAPDSYVAHFDRLFAALRKAE